MTYLAKRRSLILPAAFGLLILWATMNFAGLWAAWARNEGFLGLNRSRASREAGILNVDLNQQHIDSLERVAAFDGGNDLTWRALGYLLLEQGKEDEALAAWHYSDGIAAELFINGIQAKKTGRDIQALAWFQRAVAVAPEMVDGWLEIGAIHQQRGELEEAAAAIMSGLNVTPDSSDLFYRLGQLHVSMNRPVEWQTVLVLAERAIEQGHFIHEENRYAAHYLRGEALRNLGREHEALAEYIIVTENLPDHYWGALRRAELTWRVKEDAAVAEQYYRAAIDIDPGNKWAYRQFALDLAAMGHLDEARGYFEQVISIDADDQVAVEWLRQNP